MHELSIAQDLVALLEVKQMELHLDRIRSVTVEVGELSGVIPAALQSAWPIAVQASVLGPVVLNITEVSIQLWCDKCEKETAALSVQELRCAVCGQFCEKILRGRELDLVSIEVDDATENS